MSSAIGTTFGQEIFYKKYAGKFTTPEEYYGYMADRVSLGNKKNREAFYDMLINGRFSPGGRILAWAGRPESSSSLMNCTTHQINGDSLDDIADTARTIMRASSHGQGIGIDISRLRPRGSSVNNAAKTSTGAISFMEMLNNVGGTIGQEGRRAALLFSISDRHPDLWRKGEKDLQCPTCQGKGCMRCKGTGFLPYDFLTIKSIPGRVENANISVLISDAFMQAVEADDWWCLEFNGESGKDTFHVERMVKARELFMQLARNAWASAEPGVLFVDTARFMSNSDLLGDRWKVRGVNACTEQVLDQDGVCNLGSLNAGKYVHNPFTARAYFNYDQFDTDVHYSVIFLDNILQIELAENRSISEEQRQSIINLRRLGLGLMGLADALAMLGLSYRLTQDTRKFMRTMLRHLRDEAYETSVDLAEEFGSCEAFPNSKEDRLRIVFGDEGFYTTLPVHLQARILTHGLRNVALLSVAPTGSISNLLGASSGIEPLFALEYTRRVRMNGIDEFVQVVHPAVQQAREMDIPDSRWDTAYSVSPEDHVNMQAFIQKYVDSSISKTTNLPESATVQDVADVYMRAWKMGLKGISVYRDNSRSEQVLYTENPEKEEVCPGCGGKVIKHGGCTQCENNCGWSKCG